MLDLEALSRILTLYNMYTCAWIYKMDMMVTLFPHVALQMLDLEKLGADSSLRKQADQLRSKCLGWEGEGNDPTFQIKVSRERCYVWDAIQTASTVC
jgi:hypothetical protein